MFFKQKIDFKAVLKSIGLILFVPGVMAFVSILFCFIFKEYASLLGFFLTGLISCGVGFFLFKFFSSGKVLHMWEAMLASALGWLLVPIFGALPYIIAGYFYPKNLSVLAVSSPLNGFFEAFSGFTSTGLSMIKEPQNLPYTLQFWRAFTQWIGGVGLVVVVLTFIDPYKEDKRLFYAEARSKEWGKTLMQTGRMIWIIYLVYTFFFMVLLVLAKMPLWEAFCHTLTGISTGGFTVTRGSFSHYSPLIKLITLFMMAIGATSFSIHYRAIFHRDLFLLLKNLQNALLWILLLLGSFVLYFLAFPSLSLLDSAFQWVSAMATCGFSTKNLSLFPTLPLLFMILGMILGGSMGSTVGGIKIKRAIHIVQAIGLRIRSFTRSKEKQILKETKEEPSGVQLPKGHKSERLYEALVLFILWVFFIIMGWFLISLALPQKKGTDLLFDITSAISNVGLTSGIVSEDLGAFSKCIFLFLMWVGRLEIIPVIVLLMSPFLFLYQVKLKKRK